MDQQEIIRKIQGQGYQKIIIVKAQPKEKKPKQKCVVDMYFYVIHGQLEVRTREAIFIVKLDDDLIIPKKTEFEVKSGDIGATYVHAERA